MLYLGDQFPSAAVRLQNIRYYFISAGFELFICASIVTLPTDIGFSLVFPTLGFAERRQHVPLTNFIDTGREIFDFSFCIFVLALIVQCRREIVQFECKSKAADCV
jgi:hypothetical protein